MKLAEKSRHLRRLVLETIRRSGWGHLATAFSCADIICALYYGGVMKFDPRFPQMPDRDRFLMSKGHAATILYCALADLGFFPKDHLWLTADENGTMGVHLQTCNPGVEATSGSLGQGLGLGCGMALAARKNKINYMTYVLTGDGELNEGSIWEAVMFAAHQRLNNLTLIVDYNQMSCAGYTRDIINLGELGTKFASFGWAAEKVDGHNPEEMARAFKQEPKDMPRVFIADTVKGKGLPWVENEPMCHFYHPGGEEEMLRAIKEIEAEL